MNDPQRAAVGAGKRTAEHQWRGDVDAHRARNAVRVLPGERPDRAKDAGIVDQQQRLGIRSEAGQGVARKPARERSAIGEVDLHLLQARRKSSCKRVVAMAREGQDRHVPAKQLHCKRGTQAAGCVR